MLTLEDCIGLSELSEDEIEAIAQHEHIPQIVAVEVGNYLVQTPEGEQRIKAMIVDDIAEASAENNLARVAILKMCLKHFLEHIDTRHLLGYITFQTVETNGDAIEPGLLQRCCAIRKKIAVGRQGEID